MDIRVSIIPDGGNQPIVLGDDEAGWKVKIDEGMPYQERLFQETPLFRAPHRKIFPRGNHVERFSFQVDRMFDELPDALRFQFLHPTEVPDIGTLLVEYSVGFRVRLIRCALTVRCRRGDGASIITHYNCSGERWSL